MASYTMELKNYIEMFSQNESLSTREVIEKGRTHLFDFEYPIFDPEYKRVFETHFIRKFYMREIGTETEGLFKFNLETWLLINMPYYNKLFESEMIEFDPLTNTKLDVTENKTNDKTQTSTTTTDGTSNSSVDGTNHTTQTQGVDGTVTEDDFARHLVSNNPDSRLTITTNDGQGVIEYASDIQENNANNSRTSSTTTDSTGDVTTSETAESTSNVTATGNGSINEIEDFIQSKAGKVGSQTYSSMINEYRKSFLRIENQIFNEMQELFMLVY